MKKSTRFAREVKKLNERYGAAFLSPAREGEVIKLLKREHQAMRRKVKGMEWLNTFNELQRGQTYIVKELLDWLTARAR